MVTRVNKLPIWPRHYHAHSLEGYRICDLSLFNVSCHMWRSHRPKNYPTWPQFQRFIMISPIWNHRWLWDDAQSLKGGGVYKSCPIVFRCLQSNLKVTWAKNANLTPILAWKFTRPVAAIKSLRFAFFWSVGGHLCLIFDNEWIYVGGEQGSQVVSSWPGQHVTRPEGQYGNRGESSYSTRQLNHHSIHTGPVLPTMHHDYKVWNMIRDIV